MEQTVLILGGGFGGLSAANEARRLLPRNTAVIVVDKDEHFVVGATKTWVALGETDAGKVQHDRTRLEKRGIEFLRANVRRIAVSDKAVDTDRGAIRYDYLIIALGAEIARDAIPGLSEGAYDFYTLDAAVRLREALERFEGGRVVVLNTRPGYKCPPAPYEGAMLLADYFAKRGKKAEVSMVTFEGALPLMASGPDMGRFVVSELEKAGVRYVPQHRVVSVDPNNRIVKFENGEMPYDLLIATPPHVAPRVVKEAGLTNDSGWIPVDRLSCTVAGHDGVYAIGDVTTIELPGRFNPDVPLLLPRAGVIAEKQGAVVAKNIALQLAGRSARLAYDGTAFCYVETGGHHAGRGDAQFYAVPTPRSSPRVPSLEQFEEKKEWIRETVQRLLG
jgi:sulfide:quinone oxidoreductase